MKIETIDLQTDTHIQTDRQTGPIISTRCRKRQLQLGSINASTALHSFSAGDRLVMLVSQVSVW